MSSATLTEFLMGIFLQCDCAVTSDDWPSLSFSTCAMASGCIVNAAVMSLNWRRTEDGRYMELDDFMLQLVVAMSVILVSRVGCQLFHSKLSSYRRSSFLPTGSYGVMWDNLQISAHPVSGNGRSLRRLMPGVNCRRPR